MDVPRIGRNDSHAASVSRTARLRRGAGIAIGLGTHVLFAWTVWHLFFFLRDGHASIGGAVDVPRGAAEFAWMRDAVLALQFAIPHSLLLWPPFASRLKRIVPAAFYGLLFCLVTCVSLLLLFRLWSQSDRIVWQLHGSSAAIVRGAFLLAWGALIYSLHLQGLGYQTGWTPWWHWFRRRPQPRREFRIVGAYRLLRHPAYLGFLGLIWLTPRMTFDHAILTGLWTVYIFLGSSLKDRRLEFFLGGVYRRYAAKTPGYPLIGFGPLGRRRHALPKPVLTATMPLAPRPEIAAAATSSVPSQRAA